MQDRNPWLRLGIVILLVATATVTSACSTIWSSKLAPGSSTASTSSMAPTGSSPGAPIPPIDEPSYATTKSLPSMGFWGVWGPADRSEANVRPVADKLRAEGFEAGVVYTPEWQGLNLSPWYLVVVGPYSSRASATKALVAAQSRGHKGFHVGFSGPTTLDQGASWVNSGARP